MKILVRKCSVALCLLGLVLPNAVGAQNSITLSVTPTLFDISVEPGSTWNSSLRVVNPNDQTLTVYPRPVNFLARGETGQASIAPIVDDAEVSGTSLAEWIDVDTEAISVAPQETATIPFSVRVPNDASPGGQYAAILITTQPPETTDSQPVVRTNQAVTALFFMRVEGEVIEQGQVRSFRTERSFVQYPQNEFTLRFENQGTVHLQPQGTITIYNMWGERRGEIPVNQRSQYGKILPDSIRSFSFAWEGEFSLVDIGRYRADVTLGYGQDARSFTSAETYFWVIPLYGLLTVLGSILVLGLLGAYVVRAYVRRVLTLSGVPAGQSRLVASAPGDLRVDKSAPENVAVRSRYSLTAPLRRGWNELRERLRTTETWSERWNTFWKTIRHYRLLGIGIGFVLIVLILGAWFFKTVLVSDRAFEVVVTDDTTSDTISSEELQYQAMQAEPDSRSELLHLELDDHRAASNTPGVAIVNVSGQSGAAAELRVRLEAAGYTVEQITAELNETRPRSTIVYNLGAEANALALSRVLRDALISARPANQNALAPIVIYVGTDALRP